MFFWLQYAIVFTQCFDAVTKAQLAEKCVVVLLMNQTRQFPLND
jgi:hypothetical protein